MENEEIEPVRPKRIENPELDSLIALMEEYLDDPSGKDMDIYIFEEVMETFYGKDVFKSYINRIEE